MTRPSFDNRWMDLSEQLPKDEAEKLAGDKNYGNHGKRDANYNDIDYFRAFPADTKMVLSEERARRDGGFVAVT